MSLLKVRNARKAFGALVVTDDVSLSIATGEIHAVIGPNGAGKSCLVGAISGELPLDGGEVHFDGVRVDRWPTHRRAQTGLKRAYQVPQFFSTFSAPANVALAEIARGRTAWRPWKRVRDDMQLVKVAAEFLRLVGLDPGVRRASTLGHGEKRQLELAMSFAGQPKLLLLDEPLAGLGPGDSDRMVELLGSLKGRCAMLLVEHDVQAVFNLADRISVLVAGRIIASGSAAEIRTNDEVKAAYLGERA